DRSESPLGRVASEDVERLFRVTGDTCEGFRDGFTARPEDLETLIQLICQRALLFESFDEFIAQAQSLGDPGILVNRAFEDRADLLRYLLIRQFESAGSLHNVNGNPSDLIETEARCRSGADRLLKSVNQRFSCRSRLKARDPQFLHLLSGQRNGS